MAFKALALAEPVLRAVTAEGYTIPTPIQQQAIPHVLAGKDVLGCAQTGTGKTAAFALPILTLLTVGTAAAPVATPAPAAAPAHSPTVHHRTPGGHGAGHANTPGHRGGPNHRPVNAGPRRKIRSLILSPTRELASQIGESFTAYGKFTGLRHCVIFGGVGQGPQTRALQAGVDIVVATPGRLMDLMEQGYVDLRAVEIFVLDEADRMLDMGFIHDIRKIVAKVPGKRQTLFFSATMPPEIRKLADALLRDPVRVQVAAVAATADKIEQKLYYVDKMHKSPLLIHLINTTSIARALVFSRTKHGADRICRHLFRAGIKAQAIHGNKSQPQRQRAMQDFKNGKIHVLVATDIAARGIDIDDITHVFNYDLSHEPETYVHRIGRTGRAGASGIAVSFCDGTERSFLKNIERLTRIKLAVVPTPKDLPALPPDAMGSSHGHPARHHHGDSFASAGGGGRPPRPSGRGFGQQRDRKNHRHAGRPF